MSSILDGDDVTQGRKDDPIATNPALAATQISLLKGVLSQLQDTDEDKWQPLSPVFSFFDDAGVNPTLKNLAAGASLLSAEYDNTAGLHKQLHLQANYKTQAAVTLGFNGTVDIWVISSLDGAIYEDAANGNPGTTPMRGCCERFLPRPVTTAQVTHMLGVLVPPCKFKLLIQNNCGQAFTNVNNDNSLGGYFN